MDYSTSIQNGMTAYGADGDKIGKIVEVQAGHFVVEKGFFFPSDHYIPTSAIASVDDDNVYLSVSKDEALNQGWDQMPAAGAGAGTTDYTADPGYATTATGARDRHGERPFEHDAHADNVAHAHEADDIRVPVYEEDIAPVKREVDRGAVRVEKDVVTEDRVMDVPVTEERVRVTRVDSNDPDAVGADAFEEGVIEVPVRGQEVDVQKTARKAGEVVVEKEAETRTERVGGTVRREEVRVDDQAVDAGYTDDTRRS